MEHPWIDNVQLNHSLMQTSQSPQVAAKVNEGATQKYRANHIEKLAFFIDGFLLGSYNTMLRRTPKDFTECLICRQQFPTKRQLSYTLSQQCLMELTIC